MKVAVGLSGGVDSAVAALLLREQGHDVIGVTMTLGRDNEEKTLAATKDVAQRLRIPLTVFDFAKTWHREIAGYIRETYLSGETPNPCVRCNELVKFALLPQMAFDLGAERFATGHYARLKNDGGRLSLLRAVDRKKDQSYFLYRVRRDILKRTILPLGEFTKDDIREKAKAFGLAIAPNDESQDFCGGETSAIVAEPPRRGKIVTIDGKVLGTHSGYWNYTIGKRKGLGIGGGTPFFVIGLRPETNEVVIGPKEKTVVHSFELRDIVGLDETGEAFVKVRSAGEPKGPVIWNGSHVEIPEGLTGVAPGQSAVFFRGDEIIGGGIIAASKSPKKGFPL